MKDSEIAIVTQDKIAETSMESRVGTTFDKKNAGIYYYAPIEDPSLIDEVEFDRKLTKWRMFDDDGNHYYSGLLRNDGECIAQQMLLKWGETDAGCTRIEVFIDNEWKQEIG